MTQYLTNKVRTPDGTILQSFHRHDYKTYIDKNGEVYMVDGGTDYLRRNLNVEPSEELSIPLPQPHAVIRENLMWGTYGLSGKGKLKIISIANMEDNHIKECMYSNISDLYRKAFTDELKYRLGSLEL